jgi:hypothetical protein
VPIVYEPVGLLSLGALNITLDRSLQKSKFHAA